MNVREVWGDQVDGHTKVWRYMKSERFKEMIENGELYFAAATQFDDRFEGAVAIVPPAFPCDPRHQETDCADRAFEALRRLTKINCWHKADSENDAMWRVYANSGKGVAIRSTISNLISSLCKFRLKPSYGEEKPFYGSVRYENLQEIRLHPDMQQQLFYKHSVFSWENEFRIAISLRMAEEFGVQIPDDGIRVNINADILVEEIIFGPFLEECDIEELSQFCRSNNLADRVRKSIMLGNPRYH